MALTIGTYLWPAQARPVAVAAVVAITAVNLGGIEKTARASGTGHSTRGSDAGGDAAASSMLAGFAVLGLGALWFAARRFWRRREL